ncbi:DNA recombination protein RmuC [Aestuariivirga sp.]|uniref:DNA recombination protein RmuC n=1 Tax=Aestuariivirga sp. TaxID=2650926 RepID=UPI0025C090C7|nr:DNA recombination protein RmuC [Aestuariivirga sp.]MCA3555357.1 DNA recombination protein RmuC [Aestuariivirga sp.]
MRYSPAMDLDRTLLETGGSPVTLLHLLLAAGIFALLLLIAAVVLSWRAQANRFAESLFAQRRAAELEYRIAELSGALKSLVDQSQGSQIQLVSTLDERLSDQAERTGQSLKQLHERLAVIDAAQKNIAALSGEMLSLKDILSNKQARGAYGQARMEAIIRDGLPSHAYAFQGSLSNNTRPDCLVSLPDSDIKLVIDAKFPLEAFNALKAAGSENDLRNAEARLRGDVLKHVKDIAGKYLLPGETHETAIMFVPSESVYAELYEKFEDVIQKAHRARVILASPNVLMLLVQTLQAIFRDVRMREQAGLIKAEVTKLLEDVDRLKERVGDLQKHFGAASSDLEKLGVSAGKITKRGARIESLELQEPEGGVEIVRPKLVERG